MRKFYKPLSVLLTFTMCVSLIASALAYNGEAFLEETNQSIQDANDAKTQVDTAKQETESAKTDAEEAEKATGEGSLVNKANAAEDAYQEALEDAKKAEEDEKSAIDKVNEANAAIKGTEATEEAEATKGIEGETNEKVEELNTTAGDALDKAKETLDAITETKVDEDGNETTVVTDVEAAKTAAEAAAEAAQAAQELAVSEQATDEQKRTAANTAVEAAAAANRAVEAAQGTLNAAQQEVSAAQAAYDQAKLDYKALIEQAGGEVADIQAGASDANEIVKAANEALEKAKADLEAAEAKEGEAKSAAEAAKAAADKANESAEKATAALTTANTSISKGLGVDDITGMTAEQIDEAQKKVEQDALDAFEKAYKENDNHLIDSLGDKAFEKLKEKNISVAELTAWQEKLNEAWNARDLAEKAYNSASGFDKIGLGYQYEKRKLEYDMVYTNISVALGLDIRDMTDTDRHPTILAIFQAKTEYEVAKENASKYAEAAKAMAAAQEAKKAADDAKAKADQALKDYNEAKEALEKAQKLAELQDAKFDELKDLQANLDAAQVVLTNAQNELDEAQRKANDANTTARNILDSLPDNSGGTTTITTTTGGTGDGGGSGISIEDQAVPLAGLVTRAEFLDYLWRHEGSPAADAPTFPDVPADHEFVQAIGWGQSNRLVVGYPDGNFYPDETVTVQMVRIILGCFSDVFGTNAVAAADLTTLTGEDGDVVFNCAEVLAEFFGEEYVSAANGEDDIDVDVAA